MKEFLSDVAVLCKVPFPDNNFFRLGKAGWIDVKKV